MNFDSADIRDSHLDLEDLIAEAASQPVAVREHLARCEQCQREANQWNLIAEGVRDLAATAPEPETVHPARLPRTKQKRVPTGPWRRVTLAAGSAAAVIVLLAGAGTATGLVHFSSHGTETVLTAVTGCSQLQQADGTLEQVNGSTLIIKTASGQPVTVTTTAKTFVSMSGALPDDITNGATVMVRGSTAGQTIKAAIVTVGQPFSAVNPAGFVPVQGTVADASTAGFTLVTSSGTRIPVTTSADTLVVVPHARPAQLPAGVAIFAIGRAGPDGTLSATAVAAVSQFTSGAQLNVNLSVEDCSPRSIDEALGAISAAPVSAG